MTRNVALIILDTVRQDYFSKHATRLKSMSEVSFAQCRAASSCSVPSHASILTGELPHEHGIHSTAVDYSQLDETKTFFGDIPGYRTIGVSTNTFAGEPFGFDKLFDEFVDISWTRRFPEGLDAREFVTMTDADGLSFYTTFLKTAISHEHTLATISNGAMAQLDMMFSKLPVPKLLDDGGESALKTARKRVSAGTEPFFLFMNLMEAHTPHQPVRKYNGSLYDAPNDWSSNNGLNQWDINRNGIDGQEETVEHFRDLYAAAIDYLDRQVAEFIERVQAATDRETTFIITADHGENLGYPADGGMIGHTSSLSEGLLHVPLTLVNPPEGYDKTETEYMSQTELGSLIAGVAAGRTPDVFSDRIAAERITTTNSPDVADDERRYWERALRCVYDDTRKWIWDSLGTVDEYDLDHERPNWQHRTTAEEVSKPAWTGEFFSEDIEQFQRQDSSSVCEDVDEATRSRLEELGYI
ncbi:sulfatase-like hydrolase/transferase [Halobacteriaceae archaeon SHR40]|uniref:sulfatase-like hydrolase/transferase n=1 Tax=Halovenus amylolytica TaxID=2500550 RepID=UPI000FE2E760